jgi:hypothetical protein
MKALLLTLALSGCFIGARTEVDYAVCLDTIAPILACEAYYDWHPGWWTISGYYVNGYYTLRPQFRHGLRNHRIIIERRHP